MLTACNSRLTVRFDPPDGLFSLAYHSLGPPVLFAPPSYSTDAGEVARFRAAGPAAARALANGGTDYTMRYAAIDAPLTLTVQLRLFPDSPIVRWRYALQGDAVLTKPEGRDRLRYFAVDCPADAAYTELRLSEFDSIAHAFLPNEVPVDQAELAAGARLPGPIVFCEGAHAALFAYEHGAEYPDSYLDFGLQTADGRVRLTMAAVKGNYWHGMRLTEGRPLRSVWFEYGRDADRDALLRQYRRFFLDYIAENNASRRPYLYYNTWNAQERGKYFAGRPYLETLYLEHTLAEIELAHRLGVDVFVIDTGWYNKTGDWIVDDVRFPDQLRQVKAKLDGYGMRLGLWFNPIVAAKSTRIYREHPEYVVNRDGVDDDWGPIWETEESCGMCLCTGYGDYFLQTLIRLYREVGVTYFKWDAIGQYGCNSPLHMHGGPDTPRQEAGECYSYQMGLEMIRIVEELTAACPDAIVDFDITEAARFVGLGFLSVGKYFYMNNGPYFHSFDIPDRIKIEPNPINVFFFPGPARSRVCRRSVLFDRMIPSILFLVHFLPDKPRASQQNAVASLMLGGNGVWGDLFALDEADFALFAELTSRYKRVAEDVTRAYPRVRGQIGGSPEIYEKLNPETGRGIVVFFTRSPAQARHVTAPLPDAARRSVYGADRVEHTPAGSLVLHLSLPADGAAVVFVE